LLHAINVFIDRKTCVDTQDTSEPSRVEQLLSWLTSVVGHPVVAISISWNDVTPHFLCEKRCAVGCKSKVFVATEGNQLGRARFECKQKELVRFIHKPFLEGGTKPGQWNPALRTSAAVVLPPLRWCVRAPSRVAAPRAAAEGAHRALRFSAARARNH
jgi:hypothetical protein